MNGLASLQAQDIPGARLVSIVGEVDLSNAPEVLEGIMTEVPSGARLVVLDLTDTAYLDSSGIAMLFTLASRLRTSRRDLRLVVPQAGLIRRVIDLTAVDRVIPVSEVVGEARLLEPD